MFNILLWIFNSESCNCVLKVISFCLFLHSAIECVFLTAPNITWYLTLLQNCYVWWCSDKESPSESVILNPSLVFGRTETNLADVGSILLSDLRGILSQPSNFTLFLSAVPPRPSAVYFTNESFHPFAISTNLFPVNGNKFTLNWNLRFTNLFLFKHQTMFSVTSRFIYSWKESI
jgi:hypothetical protein